MFNNIFELLSNYNCKIEVEKSDTIYVVSLFIDGFVEATRTGDTVEEALISLHRHVKMSY